MVHILSVLSFIDLDSNAGESGRIICNNEDMQLGGETSKMTAAPTEAAADRTSRQAGFSSTVMHYRCPATGAHPRRKDEDILAMSDRSLG
jgi:hypothetical protein